MVKRHLAADEDQVVLRFLHALAGEQQLLIELLALAQTRVHHGDVHVRLQTGQADHIAREIVNAHRLAHVQHENLAAARIGAGLENELYSLGNGHEIADDALVRHGDGAALRNLLAEERNHTAGAAEHIAEAHGNILRPGALVHHLHDHLAHAL